ncbi:hypothetical protein M011DRAFT_467272 [Sporormia fimetaria CBS 119925]|uniref:N-acetyltransferase domain-containing protein n=1 Tax=Sporormia fimetaria CBS 119925 TaxID=1340428 RepID=A0A6A6VF89_9PLEO|nr:hypothetical protein M011DRAFT_467272 [Sporormia fimetaria CBS 119925]
MRAQPPKPKATWRALSTHDLTSLLHTADTIHSSLPESRQVFAERLSLYPNGCFALVNPKSNEFYGYIISHPIKRRQPPGLDSLLGQIAPDAEQYYIHDLAILPEARGCGYAREGVERVLGVAERGGFGECCAVAVYGTKGFWERWGFKSVEVGKELEMKVRSYGDDATFLERRK